MSGTPNQDEIQVMWTNATDLLEKHRVYADATAAADGELDVFEQKLEGEYAPALADVAAGFRASLSASITQAQARAFFEPLVFEYARFISDNAGDGMAYLSSSTDIGTLMAAIYEHMLHSSTVETVESRAITYQAWSSMVKSNGTSASGTKGTIVGTGQLARLTEDRNGYNLEACTVEKKVLRCVQDQNTGTKEEAERFLMTGSASSFDSLLQSSTGSGAAGFFELLSLNAGTGSGGSLLRNSSFSTFSASATPKFEGWDLDAGTAADVTQDTTNTYRQYPNSSTSASLKIASSTSDTKTLKQTLANMRTSSIDPDTPFFLRMMVNADFDTQASGGSVTLRCGSLSATETIANIIDNDWVEIRIGDATLGGGGTEDASDSWAKNFLEDGFDIEIEWAQGGGATGSINIDDVIFAPWTEIDGTFWALRQVHATAPLPWLVGDTIEVTDSGGAPGTAEIQYWLYRAGLGYLPSTTGTPTWSEPA